MMLRLCILLVALTLVACGASRQILKSDTRTAVETVDTLHAEVTIAQSGQSVTHTEVERDEEVTTEVVEFDTTLPVDPTTGTPPAKRKTRQIWRTAMIARQDIAAKEQHATKLDVATQTTLRGQTAVTTEEQTRKGLNWVQSTLCVIGLAALAALTAWLLGRRLKH